MQVMEEQGSFAEWDLSRKPFRFDATAAFIGKEKYVDLYQLSLRFISFLLTSPILINLTNPIKIVTFLLPAVNESMDIKVWDHNNYRGNVLIGESVVTLKSLLEDATSKEIPIDFNIVNKRGVISGSVTLYATYMKRMRSQCDPLCGINVAVACSNGLDFVADFIMNMLEFISDTEVLLLIDSCIIALYISSLHAQIFTQI